MEKLWFVRNIIYGLTEIIDGLIRVCTLGILGTNMSFHFLAWWEIKVLVKQGAKYPTDQKQEE